MKKILSFIMGLVIAQAVVAQTVSHLKIRPESGWSTVNGVLPTITMTVCGVTYTTTPTSIESSIMFGGTFPIPLIDYSMQDNFGRHYFIYPYVISPPSIAVYYSSCIDNNL